MYLHFPKNKNNRHEKAVTPSVWCFQLQFCMESSTHVKLGLEG